MYLAVFAIIGGQALMLAQPVLLAAELCNRPLLVVKHLNHTISD
jgi:hypothetical protein